MDVTINDLYKPEDFVYVVNLLSLIRLISISGVLITVTRMVNLFILDSSQRKGYFSRMNDIKNSHISSCKNNIYEP